MRPFSLLHTTLAVGLLLATAICVPTRSPNAARVGDESGAVVSATPAHQNLPAIMNVGATSTTEPEPARAEDWTHYRHDPQRSGRAGLAVVYGSDDKLHLQWGYSFGERVEIEVEPIVAAGRVFVGAMNGTMTALNLADGSVAWTFAADGPIPHTAAYSNGLLFFGSLDGKVYALDAATGALRWTFATGAPVYAAPLVANGMVYIGSTGGRFYALDVQSGLERWHFPAEMPLPTPFTGAAALSPDGTRLFVGNEDLYARAIDAQSGRLIWQHQLVGVGMRSTYPLVADNGATVLFATTKPGVQSYQPTEQAPQASANSDPSATWNGYYQTYPERRSTFFLAAANGAERWNQAEKRFVPLPMPYWGMFEPVLDRHGNAWLVTPGSASEQGQHNLDHDSRLVRVSLDSGIASEVAAREQFQHRNDENGRATIAGDDYLTTISEDLGVYHTATHKRATLFGNGFGTHMDPLAPLPSANMWRYGGVVAMGGVAAASTPVVADGYVLYISYGTLFVLGPQDRGLDPTGSQPIAIAPRDARLYELTYPRADAPTLDSLQAELETRVADLIAADQRLPFARYDQPGQLMQGDISGFQVFGLAGERAWVLAKTLPLLPPELRARATTYLRSLVEQQLFDPVQYAYRRDCLVYGQPAIQHEQDCAPERGIVAAWFADNELLTGERLYAMAAYSEATGDWSLVETHWSLIQELFGKFETAYDPALGFCRFPRWHVGKLGIASQIGAAAGVLRMAKHQGDSATENRAQTLLEHLLDARVKLGHGVRDQYDSGVLSPQPMRIDADGVPNHDDMFRYNDVGELIPRGGDRNRTSDVRQVIWADGTTTELHTTLGFMHYPELVGYSPLYPELVERLRRDLRDETARYVAAYEVNQPWWWMSDLAHHTTAGGEHLWESATLAHDLFQAKALVLGENWQTLRHELPLPMSINPRYDLYRLDNLATLIALGK